jgi:hypothetical protein
MEIRVKISAIAICLLGLISLAQPVLAAEAMSIETYVREFNYETRKTMKCSGKELLSMLIKKEAVLVDIRFPEEQQAWPGAPASGSRFP